MEFIILLLIIAGLVLLGLIIAISVFAFVYLSVRREKSLEESWSLLAGEYGLKFNKYLLKNPEVMRCHNQEYPRGPEVTGIYKGFDYRLYTFGRLKKRKMAIYTKIIFSLPGDPNFYLHIYPAKAGILSLIEDKIGDVETGDREVDESFIMKTGSREIMTEVITRPLGRKLMEHKDLINIKVSGKEIIFETPGVMHDMDKITFINEVMLEMGENIRNKLLL